MAGQPRCCGALGHQLAASGSGAARGGDVASNEAPRFRHHLFDDLHAPYYLARLFNSLDHVTGGRIAFNVITSTRRSDYANDDIVDHDERYDRSKMMSNEDIVNYLYKLRASTIRTYVRLRGDKDLPKPQGD